MASDSLPQSLREHLAWWGLRHFSSDRDYFAWQRQRLPSEDLKRLAFHAEQKRHGDRRDEIMFYDVAAHPTIYPVLYSQRYEYYEAIGVRTTAHFGQAEDILDFGCGIGVLTIFYARLFPEKNFVGVDRSSVSSSSHGKGPTNSGCAISDLSAWMWKLSRSQVHTISWWRPMRWCRLNKTEVFRVGVGEPLNEHTILRSS